MQPYRLTRIASLAFVLLAVASIVHAQPPVATATQKFTFDYKTSDFTTFAVLRFELQVDGGAWVSVNVPATTDDATTPAGSHSYDVPIPALVTGNHTWTVRACNAQLCSDPMTPMAFVLAVKPPAPSGLRIK
jgi:hypothetical protein